MRKLFSFALIPLAIASGGVSSKQQIPQSGYIIAQSTNGIASLWKRRTVRHGARGGTICAIAPGLVDTYILWSDRPLFLWHNFGTDQEAQLVVRDDDTQQVVWEKTVKISDQKAVYNAQESLEPGKSYQWQLSGYTFWNTFQVMGTSDRTKILTDLQTLEQKLKVNKASAEEIAIKKADYFLNYEIKHQTQKGIFYLWSDAFQTLYQVEKPSQSFVKQREEFTTNICTKPSSNS